MRQNFMTVVLTCVMLSMAVGCVSINSVSLTPIPSQRTRPIRAEVSKRIFLGFNFDNDYIDPLVEELKRQCQNGIVSGILTKDETVSYFILFTKRVSATGFCNVPATKAAKMKASPRKPGSAEDTSAYEELE